MNNEYCMRVINAHRIMVNKYKAQEVLLEKKLLRDANASSIMTIRQMVELLKLGDNSTPFSLRWELTNRCNLSCPFCYIHGHVASEDISLTIAKPYIDYLLANGLLFVTLTGGECTLNEDFLRIYVYLKEHGVLVKVFTNGISIGDDIYETFDRYKPYRVEISLYSRYQQDSRAYNTILKLKKMGVNVLAKSTVTASNHCDFQSVKQWCLDNGISFKFDTEIFDAYDGKTESEFELTAKEKARLNSEKVKCHTAESQRSGSIRCFDCNGGRYSILIDSQFSLRVCGKVKNQFHLHGNTMEAAYAELQQFVSKYCGKEIMGCTCCRAYPICKMCYAFAIPKKANETTEMHVDKEFCKKTIEYYDQLYTETDMIDKE